MVSPVNDAAWLQWIERLAGGPARNTTVLELPPSRFHCRLDDQPTHLVPERSLRAVEESTDCPLLLNSSAVFTRDDELPPELEQASRLTENFALQGNLVWIRDPRTEALQPFWLGIEFSGLLAGMRPGDPVAELPPAARGILALAGVLEPEDHVLTRRQWLEQLPGVAEQFRQKRYVPLGQLVHPLHVAALRRYYRYLIRTGELRLGDSICPRRYVAHNESVARFFHHQLTRAVCEIAGEPVKPSYVYLASYQGGEKLDKHVDRPQCDFSITLCLDYTPEPRHATPWPLHVHTKSGKVTVFQGMGDGLLYRGRELPHSRNPLPKGSTSTSLFFHYVGKDFTGSLD